MPDTKMGIALFLQDYFRRSKEHSDPVDITKHADVKFSHDYQLLKFILSLTLVNNIRTKHSKTQH